MCCAGVGAQSPGTGFPQRLWSLLLGDLPKPHGPGPPAQARGGGCADGPRGTSSLSHAVSPQQQDLLSNFICDNMHVHICTRKSSRKDIV